MYFNIYEVELLLHENQLDVVLLHIILNDINNQIKDKGNTEKLTENIINTDKC